MDYIPNTNSTIQQMLSEIGVNSFEDLITQIPKAIRSKPYSIANGLSEPEVLKEMERLAYKNKAHLDWDSYLGGGAYESFVPSIIPHLISRGEFLTAYTPYQPEVSQGTLQMIYEYQTMICRLTGMEVSNASLYDGGSATAEACLMAARIHANRKKILVSKALHPSYQHILKTYFYELPVEIVWIEEENGQCSLVALEKHLDENLIGLVVQYPNFFGVIENLKNLKQKLDTVKALLVVVANPLALACLKSPASCGADIVVGDAQVFGCSTSFGGPYLGYMATWMKYVRKMPGRIVGQTQDASGKRGFVLTFQTREQHIRREKATSNICTNQGLMVLRACIYLSLVGKNGLKAIAQRSAENAHYLYSELQKIGMRSVFAAPFFNEFSIKLPDVGNIDEVLDKMKQKNILPGIVLKEFFPSHKKELLVYVNELKTKEQLDHYVESMKSILLSKPVAVS